MIKEKVSGYKKELNDGREVFLGRFADDDKSNYVQFVRQADEKDSKGGLSKLRQSTVAKKDGKIITTILLTDESLKALVELYDRENFLVAWTYKVIKQKWYSRIINSLIGHNLIKSKWVKSK